MNRVSYIPISRPILIAMIILIVPSLTVLSLSVYLQTSRQIREDYRLLRQQTEKNMVHMVELADTSYQMLEHSLDDQMRQAFTIFLRAYEEADRRVEKMDLTALQKRMGLPADLYIINAAGVIIATTYEPDRGLDFSQFPGFYEIITEYRRGDSYHGDRLSQEMESGTIRRYAYHPTPDHRYLLELGLKSQAFQPYMGALDPARYADALKELNPALRDIMFISSTEEGKAVVSDNAIPLDQQPLAPNQEIVQQLLQDPEFNRHQMIDPETGNYLQFIYINLDTEEAATSRSRLLRIEYSRAPQQQAINNILGRQLLISLLVLILALCLSFIIARRIANPIHRIVEDVDLIASGDLEHRIQEKSTNELFVLERSINQMKETILTYMDRYRRSEEKLREQNEHLEEQVRERSRQLIETEKMAAMSHLVIGVAHEINTPVGVSVTAASFLQDVQETLTEKISRQSLTKKEMENFLHQLKESNGLIQRNLSKAADLIKRFKEISAVTTDQEEISRFRPADYLGTLLNTMEDSFHTNHARFHLEVPESLHISTHSRGFGQVMTQLIQNFLDHVCGAHENPELRIFCRKEADGVEILIEDNGPGISPEVASRIFEPFYTTNRGSHSGLGLHIVYNTVVQKLKGSVSLRKTSPGGTQIRLFLPNMQA